MPAFVVHGFNLAGAVNRGIFLAGGLSEGKIRSHREKGKTNGDAGYPEDLPSSKLNGVSLLGAVQS